MFTPHLRLLPQGNKYILFAAMEVPNETFSAGKVELGAPDLTPVGAGVVAYQLHLAHSAEATTQITRTIEYRIPDLKIKTGDTVTAFVVLDGRVLGTGSILLSGKQGVSLAPRRSSSSSLMPVFRATTFSVAPSAAERPPLTSELCQAITVRNTPKPSEFTGPSQTLDKLGVIDDTQAKSHKSAIQQDLNQIGWHIQQADIQSGPAKTVRDCSDSMENNAS